MHVLGMSCLVFVLVFGGALSGMAVRRVTPDERFTLEAKDSIRLAIGLVVTMTGLVLGMLVSSGKSFYDEERNRVADLSSQVIFVNDLLTAYGPEAKPLRVEARRALETVAERIWPEDSNRESQLEPANTGSDFYQQVQVLVPKNDAQANIKTQLLPATLIMRKSYWLLFLQSKQTSITIPILSAVTAWLVVIFFSFGIFAPRMPNVVLTFAICSMSVSVAIFIILSMNLPFSGAFRISPDSVRAVLSQMPTK